MAAAELPGAEEWVPPSTDLKTLDSAVDGCRGSDLYQNATQAVFGQGPGTAKVVVVLGASAARSLLGTTYRVTKQPGRADRLRRCLRHHPPR